jgi:uncharacterized membrane protein
MTRSEFMDSLHRALAGSLTSSTVNENMRYYEEYFDTQIRSGQSEEEIIAGLGDPRLLAKTIIQASKYQAQNFSNQEYDEVYEDGSQDDSRNGRGDSPKIYRMPGWLLLIIVLVVAFVVISVLSSVVSMLLPIIIPVFCVVLIVRMLRKGS